MRSGPRSLFESANSFSCGSARRSTTNTERFSVSSRGFLLVTAGYTYLDQKEYEEVRRKIETAARVDEDIKPDKSRIKREKYDDNAQKWDDRRKDADAPREKRSRMWVMPNLRVRFVDEKYKRGEYFKKKMVVVEAADRDNCELRDDSGRMHYSK